MWWVPPEPRCPLACLPPQCVKNHSEAHTCGLIHTCTSLSNCKEPNGWGSAFRSLNYRVLFFNETNCHCFWIINLGFCKIAFHERFPDGLEKCIKCIDKLVKEEKSRIKQMWGPSVNPKAPLHLPRSLQRASRDHAFWVPLDFRMVNSQILSGQGRWTLWRGDLVLKWGESELAWVAFIFPVIGGAASQELFLEPITRQLCFQLTREQATETHLAVAHELTMYYAMGGKRCPEGEIH